MNELWIRLCTALRILDRWEHEDWSHLGVDRRDVRDTVEILEGALSERLDDEFPVEALDMELPCVTDL